MTTIEKIVGFALHDRSVMDQLGEALKSDLVVANPFYRQIASFGAEFTTERGKLPLSGDWELWISSLAEGQRDGARESLGRLLAQDVTEYDPEYFGERVLEELRQVASRTALARLNSLTGDGVTPEAFRTVLERIEAITCGSGKVEETWPTLREILTNADIAREPEEIVPRIVWRGRHTLMAGLAKLGKSTIATQAAAAVTRAAPFLDGKAAYGRVLWAGIDEHVGETARRFEKYLARPKRIRILSRVPADLRGSLESALDEFPADLLVVDSLIEWARRTLDRVPDDGDSSGWARVVRPLTSFAHDRNVGVLTLHHSRRSDGRYRSSGEIAAGVDVIYEMLGPTHDEDQASRRFEGVGRWEVGKWNATMNADGMYEIGGGLIPPEEQIFTMIERTPGISRDELARDLGLRRSRVAEEVQDLLNVGRLVEPRRGSLYSELPKEEGEDST